MPQNLAHPDCRHSYQGSASLLTAVEASKSAFPIGRVFLIGKLVIALPYILGALASDQ